MTRAKFIFTSILPRLVDHRDSEFKVCKVNAELKNFVGQNIYYIVIYIEVSCIIIYQIRVYMLLVMGFT